MRTLLLTSAAAMTLAACGPKANDATPNVEQVAAAQTTQNMVVGEADADPAVMAAATADTFALNAAQSDIYEMTSSKMAVEKSTNPAIKKFAQEMVDAHNQTTRALKAATAKDNVSLEPRPELDPKRKAMLAALEAAPPGANFDALYVEQQRAAHTETLTLMKSFAGSNDAPALKAFATETAPKVQMHLDMVGKLG